MNCRIEKESIYLNGEEVFTATGEDFSSFAKGAYRHLELNYPKFFKMDKLSKLAFLGAEYLLMGYSAAQKEGTALVLANRSGSLDTDLVHQQALEAGDPASPAVFVYTLANICLGEIAIRHQLRSEGHFFVFDQYPEEFFIQYSQYLVQEGLAERVLCGWVELLGADYSLKFVIY
jgi:3-oxoacyl-[acyl-carrier-protein] synthase